MTLINEGGVSYKGEKSETYNTGKKLYKKLFKDLKQSGLRPD